MVSFLTEQVEGQRVHGCWQLWSLGLLLGSCDKVALLGSVDVDRTFHRIIRESPRSRRRCWRRGERSGGRLRNGDGEHVHHPQ